MARTRSRATSEPYLRSVEEAVASPGKWIKVAKVFEDYNVSKTAACLRGGYLRLVPREGDIPVRAEGRECIKTAGPVETRIERNKDGSTLFIRFAG